MDILYRQDHHQVRRDSSSGLEFISNNNGNRGSFFYKSIKPFAWRGFNNLYLAESNDQSREDSLAYGSDLFEWQTGVKPGFIVPKRFLWAPNGVTALTREVPVDLYEPEIDEFTGYVIHRAAEQQLVDPLEGTVTEGAQKFRISGDKIFGMYGADIFHVTFGSPEEMSQRTKQRYEAGRNGDFSDDPPGVKFSLFFE
ncbi:hypothetical protein HOA92_03800 [archaeon]|jgi:hypothetical protein|nr:hypothetical protein [archaeon]MBT6762136.1 hypothetical protein [archaeon]